MIINKLCWKCTRVSGWIIFIHSHWLDLENNLKQNNLVNNANIIKTYKWEKKRKQT